MWDSPYVFDLSQLIYAIIYTGLILPPVWFIFKKAGLARWQVFIVLIPYFGLLVTVAILAHRSWTTVPKLELKKRIREKRRGFFVNNDDEEESNG